MQTEQKHNLETPMGKPPLHDQAYFKNIIGFSVLLCICVASLGFLLVSGDRQVGRASEFVEHTHDVILAAEELNSEIEAMLSSQRGYLLSGEVALSEQYRAKKEAAKATLNRLKSLTHDNTDQMRRLKAMDERLDAFSDLLENRMRTFAPLAPRKNFVSGFAPLNGLKDSITSSNMQMLQDEYDLLNARVIDADVKRNDYFFTLLLGGSFVTVLLLLFNGFLFHVQDKRLIAERILKDTEERFSLAIEGTSDGIFDWNVLTDEVFYSRQFYAMLGQDRSSHIGSIAEFRALIHPQDEKAAWQYMERYLRRELAEYSNTFRMKHAESKWIWVNSRAKAIFDTQGRALRMVGANINITQMKEYQERLKAEKENADRANRAKSDFLAHMSHEIRTPLTAISGIADIFTHNQANLGDKQKQLIEVLHSSTSSLKELINDVLDFSKIESGELELTLTHFPLGAVFEQATSIMSVHARQKGLDFKFDHGGLADEIFYGDRVRLRQILINLIGNAIKFTEAGEIVVKAHKGSFENIDMLYIDVADTGIGIAADNREMIFERFKQADSSVSRKYGGTGLGLPISRSLARLMNGTIEVESAVGEGSVFTLSLPFLEAGHEADVIEEKEIGTNLNAMIRSNLEDDTRILIVEDYVGNIVVISYILDEIGCAYDVAHNGVEGLALWREKPYDIILMDIQMPEMDGFTATATIRKTEREMSLLRTPIIGMTAHALIGDKDKCIAAGMDAYLPKPIVETDLKKELLKYIKFKKNSARARVMGTASDNLR